MLFVLPRAATHLKKLMLVLLTDFIGLLPLLPPWKYEDLCREKYRWVRQ